MQKQKSFSLIGYLAAKVNAHDGLAGIGHLENWMNELKRDGIYYDFENAKRRLRQLRDEGKIEIIKIRGVSHYRKATLTVPAMPSHPNPPEFPESCQMFQLEDWGKAYEPNFDFTKTIKKHTHA